MNATMMLNTTAPTATRIGSSTGRSLLSRPCPLALPARSFTRVQRSQQNIVAKFTKQAGKQLLGGDKKRGYDKSAKEVNPATPAFTRRRELFAGRLAMVGFASATIAELLTGQGILGQLRLYTGASQQVVDTAVLGLILFNFVSALNPASPTFSEENQADVRKRPSGPIQDPRIQPNTPKKFFGITNFGFTKKNELFVGRWAMVGFAAALIGEKLTGKGPVGQLGLPFDLPINPGYAAVGLAAWVSFFLIAAIGFGNLGQTEGDEGIY